MSGRRPGLFGSIFVILIGALFVGAGFLLHRQSTPFPDGVSTTGTITGVQRVRGNDGKSSYAALVTFTARDGREVTVQESSSSSNRPDVGNRVDVSYRVADPEGARIIPEHDWFSWLCWGMGGLVVVLGVGHLIRNILRIAGFVAAAVG